MQYTDDKKVIENNVSPGLVSTDIFIIYSLEATIIDTNRRRTTKRRDDVEVGKSNLSK